MSRKAVILVSLGFACIMAVQAGGNKDNLSLQADNPAGFTDSVNIENNTPGKYNFFIEAMDRAGNRGLAGPDNIFIDPESDLPITTIINPRNNMHVQGNLNMVGIAVDDDAVEHVEFTVHRGADGRGEELVRGRATGAEFWSYTLDTSDTEKWPDGVYSVTAWSVDVNGLSGISPDFRPKSHKKHTVAWHLDRKKPDTRVTSHDVGALVAGRIRLRGTVYDGNGVETLRYALGEGSRYQPVPLKYDRRSNSYSWELAIDTKTLEDGPAVVWFQARDGMGTLGVAAHLLFVNNTSPEVEIVYPEPEVPVSGVFTISGYATHPVGIKSVSWKLGRESGEFPLVIGNPWWVKEFDIRGEKAANLDLEIRAEDLSGNVTTVKRRLRVDQLAGLPKVTLEEPAAGAVVTGDSLNVRGFAGDNDAVASVLYSIDSQAAVEIPASGYFQFSVPSFPPGVHTLDVWAKDYTGIEGPKTQVRGLVAPGQAPQPRFTSVTSGSGKTASSVDFYSGMEINGESGSALDLLVSSGSALQSVSYQLGSKAPVTVAIRGGKAGDFTLSIPVPPDSDCGQVRVEVKAADIHNRETVLEEFIFITNLTSPRVIDGHVPVNQLRRGPLALTGVGGESSWPLQIVVPRGERRPIPVSASIDSSAQAARAVFTVAGRPPVNAQVRGGEISANLPADLPAGLTQVTLTVTRKTGETDEVSGEFWLLRPRAEGQQINTNPGFTLIRPAVIDGRVMLSTQEPLTGIYNGRPLQSVIAEGPGADSIDVRLDERGRVRLQAKNGGKFGPLTLTLTDRDGGEFVSREYSFIADNGAPQLQISALVQAGADENAAPREILLTEAPPLWTQDSMEIRIKAGDANSLRDLDISTDLGVSWKPLFTREETARLNFETSHERSIDLKSFDDGLISIYIRAVNEAGRSVTQTFAVQKDTRAPKPQLIVPISGARVNGTIRLGIAIEEAGSLRSVRYRGPALPENPSGVATKEIYPGSWDKNHPPRFLDILLDAAEIPLNEQMFFVFEDKAGNVSELGVWPFIIDREMDIPTAHIILPLDNEVITADFEVSGVMFDDDAVTKVYWRIDDGEENILAAENGFSIPVALGSLTDNEHSVTVTAEDMYGVKSEPVTRNFRVSLTEPTAQVTLPAFEDIVRETVLIGGSAFDRNGIGKVQVSLDSGNTFNDALITTEPAHADGSVNNTAEWSYRYNSTIFQDGSHVVFVRVYDNYGIQAIYSSLINLDNTPPEITLDFPRDGAVTTGPVYITGQAIDANLHEITIELRSLDGAAVPDELKTRKVDPSLILMEGLNLSTLADGLYNIEIWAIDKADNVTRVSRNVELARESRRNFVEILYPLEGEHVQGTFNLYGSVGGIDQARTVTLRINDRDRITTDVTAAGYYRFSIDGEQLADGLNILAVHSNFGGEETVMSGARSLYYEPSGPWVTIDSLDMGDFAYDRPWFSGRAGYVLSEADEAVLADKNADRELRADIRGKTLGYIDLSFDNGNTFVRAGNSRDKDADWQYRLETGDMKEGIHYILVRANMANGETAITRTLLQVDKTPPFVRLIAPQAGGRYNQELEYAAMANDNVELASLRYHLRKGDKAAYEIPGFLQGLYFDVTIPPFIRQITNEAPSIFAGGISYMDFGLGLSFFDDNVKLQAQYGFMTQELYKDLGGEGPVRYGGQILGLKLLASVYTLPFGSFAGPDWEWLSASFSVGANFSLFNIANEENPQYTSDDAPVYYTQSGSPTWMSALLLQVEFPKITIPKRTSLRTFSLYTEGQLWFVPTDVDAAAHGLQTIIPHIILGLRMYIF